MSRAEKIAKMATTTAGQAKQDSVVSRKRKRRGRMYYSKHTNIA